MPTLTQDQLDALYIEQRNAEMRDAAERRVVNWIQGVAAVVTIILAVRILLLHKK